MGRWHVDVSTMVPKRPFPKLVFLDEIQEILRPPNTQGDSSCHRHPGGLPSACASCCWPGRFSKGSGPPRQPSPGARPHHQLPDTALGGDPSQKAGRRCGSVELSRPSAPPTHEDQDATAASGVGLLYEINTAPSWESHREVRRLSTDGGVFPYPFLLFFPRMS